MIKIGVDLSPLQGAHRMRGIGYVTRRTLENVPDSLLTKVEIIFYTSDDADLDTETVLDGLHLPKNLRYTVRKWKANPASHNRNKLQKILKAFHDIYEFKSGHTNLDNVSDLDAFIQFDQSEPFPRLNRSTRKVLIAYDLIPYVLESDYLWNYKTARRKGRSRKNSLKLHIKRGIYKLKLSLNCNSSDQILAISKTTQRDLMKYLGIAENKLTTITLGADFAATREISDTNTIELGRYYPTSFGYMPRPYTLNADDDFMLFVGGADARRKLDDLVAAFNQVRARGYPLKLVLAGDTMQGPDSVPTPSINKALKDTAFKDDIIYVGFIADTSRNWLYRNANAYIFPSTYEGFGLPVLEALSYGTRVISYPNSATKEVAANMPTYVDNVQSMTQAIISCIGKTHATARNRSPAAKLNKYTWKATSRDIFSAITNSLEDG